jgi:hypothetical protein
MLLVRLESSVYRTPVVVTPRTLSNLVASCGPYAKQDVDDDHNDLGFSYFPNTFVSAFKEQIFRLDDSARFDMCKSCTRQTWPSQTDIKISIQHI